MQTEDLEYDEGFQVVINTNFVLGGLSIYMYIRYAYFLKHVELISDKLIYTSSKR